MTLDADHPFKWYPPPPDGSSPHKLWTPLNAAVGYVSVLEAWYDAEDSSSVTVDGSGNVSQWNDKSVHARHLTDTGTKPKWGQGAQINGMNVMHYASILAQMDIDISSVDMTELAILGVGEPKAAGDWPAMGYIASTDASDAIDARLQNDATDGKINAGFKLNGTSTNIVSSPDDASIRDDVPFVFALWYDGADAVARTNGGTVSKTVDAADGATFTMNRIQCGRQTNTPRNYHGEMIVLSTSDLATIQKAEGYLAWKWGQVDRLDAGHPYKNSWPTL